MEQYVISSFFAKVLPLHWPCPWVMMEARVSRWGRKNKNNPLLDLLDLKLQHSPEIKICQACLSPCPLPGLELA